MAEYETTGLELKMERKAARITATELWLLWPCSSGYIANIESRRTVTPNTAARYREVLAEAIRTRPAYEAQWVERRRDRLSEAVKA